MIIPKDSTAAISFRANTGPVDKQTPVLFAPIELVQLSDGLEINETSLNIKPGKTSKVQIVVYNETDHDIVLRGCTSLGVLQAVKSVTPADVRLSECRIQNDHEHVETAEPQGSRRPTPPKQQEKGGENPLPAVDLSGLGHDQRIAAETMLREECESFSSNEDDIGCIPDLEMEINLKDNQAVQKKYTSISSTTIPRGKTVH